MCVTLELTGSLSDYFYAAGGWSVLQMSPANEDASVAL